jgi:transcriptional regulator
MTREEMIEFLKKKSSTAQGLATEFKRNLKAVEEDIDHIRTSIRDDPEYRLMVRPPVCEMCSFQFNGTHIKTPTKCPECKAEKISLARFKIERK